MMNCGIRLGVAILLTSVLTGCGGKRQTAAVTGTVTYDGKPLPSGTIILETSDARPAVGKIVNGKIVEMTTYKPGDGAPLGTHKVAIQAVDTGGSAVVKNPGETPTTGGNYMQTRSLIPRIYGDPEKSGLTAEITDGENVLKFNLKKNP